MGPSTILAHDDPQAAPRPRGRSSHDHLAAQTLATEVARTHGEALLRTARRFSESPDDAHDAYQRALELLLEHAATVDRAKVVAWMHVVVRREAGVLRRRHDRHVPFDVDTVDELQLADHTDDELSRIDLAQRAGEALATLKDVEAQALCLRAQGLSYEEIADAHGWSYTKVNRAVSEGRRAFIDHYLGAERGEVCERSGDRISAYLAGELRPRDQVRLRAHLSRCPGCRAQLHAERGAAEALRALLPPVLATPTGSAWLHDHLLGPLGELAGRLAPVSDHALNAKVGVAAASVAALAGGGVVAVEQQTASHPPALRAGLTADPPSRAASSERPPSGGVVTAVDAAASRGARIAETARERAAAAQRRAEARRNAAAKRRAESAAAREFSPATTEFSGSATTASTATRSSGTTTSPGSTGTTSEAGLTGPAEVTASAGDAGNDIGVTDLSGTP